VKNSRQNRNGHQALDEFKAQTLYNYRAIEFQGSGEIGYYKNAFGVVILFYEHHLLFCFLKNAFI
jgi:hypothetical protein